MVINQPTTKLKICQYKVIPILCAQRQLPIAKGGCGPCERCDLLESLLLRTDLSNLVFFLVCNFFQNRIISDLKVGFLKK